MLGVLYALTQTDIKRLLAYSTIENAGIIVLGLGAGMMALAHGHGGAGGAGRRGEPHARPESRGVQGPAVPRRGERRDGDRHAADRASSAACCAGCRGPALFFLVGAMAISGLPLLNGFASEWLTFQALLLGFASTPGLVRLNFPLGGAMLALTTALAAACFVQGVRHQFPGAAAERRGRRGARIARGDARPAGVSRRVVRRARSVPRRRARHASGRDARRCPVFNRGPR